MTKEVWKEVPGHPEYKISNFGRFESSKTGIPKRLHGTLVNSNGHVYRKYHLVKGLPARQIGMLAHILVYWAFTGLRPERDEYIAHKNLDTLDNRLENLELRKRPAVGIEMQKIKIACRVKGVRYKEFLKAISDNVDELVAEFVLSQRIDG